MAEKPPPRCTWGCGKDVPLTFTALAPAHYETTTSSGWGPPGRRSNKVPAIVTLVCGKCGRESTCDVDDDWRPPAE